MWYKKKSFLSLVIKGIMIIVAVLYVLSSLTPFLVTNRLNPTVLFSISFPIVLFTYCVVAVLSIFVFKKQCWIFFVVVLIGIKNIRSSIGFNLKESQLTQKNGQDIRILSWNVEEFIENIKTADDATKKKRHVILQFIKEVNADIVCLQDFRDFPEDALYNSNKKYLIDSLKYPDCFITLDDTLAANYSAYGYGTAIFSKYPIIDTGRIPFDFKHKPEHLNYADILIRDKWVRFYNTHFRSFNLGAKKKEGVRDYSFIQDDTAVIFNKGKLYRLLYFDSIHVRQAQLVKQQLNKSPLPFVFCADLNSVPSSYVYHHISSGLQDAFLQKGFGWGATYDGLSHTLRIDVTLLSPQLKVVQHYCPKLKASDHFPLVTDIALP